MVPDEVRTEEVQAWLRKSALDLRAAGHDLAAPDLDLWSDAAFHAQQAVEKCYKALLTAHDVPYRKIHSLEELGRRCLSLDPSLADLVALAAPLTEYAWKFRYPGESDTATQEEAVSALKIAATVCNRIRQALERLR